MSTAEDWQALLARTFEGKEEILKELKRPGIVQVYVSGHDADFYVRVVKADVVRIFQNMHEECAEDFSVTRFGGGVLLGKSWKDR